jgi:hypothetical protein
LVEHNLDMVLQQRDRVTVMVTGSVLHGETPSDVHNHPEVLEPYIGTDAAAQLEAGPSPETAPESASEAADQPTFMSAPTAPGPGEAVRGCLPGGGLRSAMPGPY